MENLLKLSQFSNGELTKLRRRQQRQRQKAIVLAKKQLCTCITLSCTFLCRPCTTTTWNDQILLLLLLFFFFWGRERQGHKFYHLCLDSGTAPLFSSNRNSLLSSDWVTWDNREVVLKGAKSNFQRRFHWRRRCRIVRSLLIWQGGR